MKMMIKAACLSDRGRVRGKNEDNFYFGGSCMLEANTGLREPAYICQELGEGTWLAVFDGMGGERFGETAAFAAADEMRRQCEQPPRAFASEKDDIAHVCMALNDAVVNTAKQQAIMHMGTTLAALYMTRRQRLCLQSGRQPRLSSARENAFAAFAGSCGWPSVPARREAAADAASGH